VYAILGLKFVGIASWAYLAFVHVGLLCYDEYMVEFESCYLSALHASSQPNTSDQPRSAEEHHTDYKGVAPILLMILMKCTWSKRKTPMLEKCVQDLDAMIYLRLESRLPLVVLAHLLYPVAHVVIGTIIYRPLATTLMGALISKLQQAVLQREVMSVRAESQRINELLDDPTQFFL